MKSKTTRCMRGALFVAPLVLSAGASAGPVLLSGDAADSHAPPGIYAHLLGIQLDNVTNGQNGILAIGVDVGSPAASWIVSVSAHLPVPQQVAFINGETIAGLNFSNYAMLYVPSPSTATAGGITQAESDLLNGRAADVADFLTDGGGLFGLTQSQLSNPYGYLGDFAPVTSVSAAGGVCGDGEPFNNVSPTALGDLFGITPSNLDGCCWHNVFSAHAESLVTLATANEPSCAAIAGRAAVLAGFVELPEINFDPPSVFGAAGAPSIESVGDLDGNGTIDVATAIPNLDPKQAGVLQIFLNQGTDEFDEWQGLVALDPITVGRNPSGVAVGLFNADAHLDLAVPNKADNSVSVLLNTGNGDGTFLTPMTIPAGGNAPAAIVAADLNEDGLIDLGVVLEDDDSIVILAGDGNGGFLPNAGPELPPLFAGAGPTSMLSGDFDNNKCPDLAGGGSEGSALAGASGSVFVLKGMGGGAYAPAVFYPVGVDPVDVSKADFNGDGFLDIVAANSGDGTVSVLLNEGDGTFAPALTLPVGAQPRSVEAVDLNDDQDPDIAVVAIDQQIGAAVQVLQNRLEGAALLGIPFDPPKAFSVNGNPNFVVSADMDANGIADLITVNSDNSKTGGSTTVLLNNPNPVDCPGDMDGDGYVNINDLLELLGSLGYCPDCPADLNGDDVVNVQDLLQLLGLWGPCPSEAPCPFDLDLDGVVGPLDVIELLQHVGDCDDPSDCPWDLDGDGHVGLFDLILLLLNFGDCPGR